MPRRATPPRPKPVEIGPLRASTMKRWKQGEDGILWYWRGRRAGARGAGWGGGGPRPYIQRRLAELVADGVPAPRRASRRADVHTLGDLLDEWSDRQQQRPDLASATVDHYQKCARHLVAWLREVEVRRVDRDTLERYRDDRLREGASRRLVVQELKILAMVWLWGQECGHVPARLLPRVVVHVDDTVFVINHRTPTPADVGAVLARLEGDYALAVRLLAITGARVSEVCQLGPDNLDLHGGNLVLDGKTGLRSFPLPNDLLGVLAERASGGALRLLDLPPKSATQAVRDRLRRACKAASVPRFTPHGLRRMVVDRMARGGVDVATAASLTGHSVEVMLRYYRQVSDEDRRRAVAAARLVHFPGEGEVIEGPWSPSSATGTDT